MVGGLHAVRVPSGEEEALRDLVGAREDVRGDLMRARHRLGKLLLRHDVRYDDAGEERRRLEAIIKTGSGHARRRTCTTPGAGSTTSAASAARSSRSLSPANWSGFF